MKIADLIDIAAKPWGNRNVLCLEVIKSFSVLIVPLIDHEFDSRLPVFLLPYQRHVYDA